MTHLTLTAAQLRISPSNVRKIGKKDSVTALLASITAHGLLNNLLVKPADDKGIYDVFAGGRRLRAIQQGIKTKQLPKDFAIMVTVHDGAVSEDTEKSLAENLIRFAMTPADECRAFLDSINDDGDIEAVANRFGQTIRYVEGRLRLARLAKPIFDALAKGDISLEVAIGYCATPDQTKQLAVWKQVKGTHQNNYASVRRLINDGAIESTHPIALFVGEDAYVAAGGEIARELFTANEQSDWLNGALARELAEGKMIAAASQAQIEQGLGWITPTLEVNVPWQQTDKLHPYWGQKAVLTEAQTERAAAIDAQCDALEALLECGDDQDQATIDAAEQCRALEIEYNAITKQAEVIPDDDKPFVGTFMMLERDGTARLHHQLYTTQAPNRVKYGADDNGGKGSKSHTQSEAGENFSARLIDELAVQRRDILALYLAGDPALALDVTIFQLASSVLGDRALDTDCTIAVNRLNDPNIGEVASSHAALALDQIAATLDTSWAHHSDGVAAFTAFRAIPEDGKVAWLAYATAKSLQAARHSVKPSAFQYHIAAMLEVDVAAHWRPTAENYFDRVPKASILATLGSFGDAALVGRFSASKKGDLAKAAEKICAGDSFNTPDVKAKALAWLPAPMTFDASISAPVDQSGDVMLEPLGDDEAVEGNEAAL